MRSSSAAGVRGGRRRNFSRFLLGVFDLRPVGVEVELRAVVEIVALQAVVDCPLLGFRGVEGQAQFRAEPIAFNRAGPYIAPLHGSMGRRRAVTVFTALVGQMGSLSLIHI